MVIHTAYIAGSVLYIHVCPREPDTDCPHEGPQAEPGPYHRICNFPAVPPQAFPGDRLDWQRYCAQHARYIAEGEWRDNNATVFLPELV